MASNDDDQREPARGPWTVSRNGPPWVRNADGAGDLLQLLGMRQLDVIVGRFEEEGYEHIWWATCNGQVLTKTAPSYLTAVDIAMQWASESVRDAGRAQLRLTCAEKRIDEGYRVGDHGRVVSERDGLVAQTGWSS